MNCVITSLASRAPSFVTEPRNRSVLATPLANYCERLMRSMARILGILRIR